MLRGERSWYERAKEGFLIMLRGEIKRPFFTFHGGYKTDISFFTKKENSLQQNLRYGLAFLV